ncbi:MAG: glycosyltransferase [Lachnospiraceae bacterium]|nr:glycosyltransferase [Lachnospiraceae bacterium]
MDLISIIVPAYNIENYIARCLDSILAQTYTELQIIIVDDGSTDGTPQICDEYVTKDSRIKVIHKKNGGVSTARNAGLKEATGKYIGYVDPDDYIEPDMYERMHRAMINNPVDLVICSYSQMGPGAEKYNFSGKEILLSKEEALDAYICDNRDFHIFNSVWSKFYARELVENIKFTVGHDSEDILYTTEALANCKGCVFIDIPLYNYQVAREGSIMNSFRKLADRRLNDEIPFLFEQIDYFRVKGLEAEAQKDEYHVYRRLGFYYIDFRKRKMKDAAKKLAGIVRKDKKQVRDIFDREFVKAGDRKRMKMFLFSPGLYYHVNNLYEKTILKIRSK